MALTAKSVMCGAAALSSTFFSLEALHFGEVPHSSFHKARHCSGSRLTGFLAGLTLCVHAIHWLTGLLVNCSFVPFILLRKGLVFQTECNCCPSWPLELQRQRSRSSTRCSKPVQTLTVSRGPTFRDLQKISFEACSMWIGTPASLQPRH